MFSYEDRRKAVELYIANGYRVGLVIRELGYPSPNALRAWHREYEKTGYLKAASAHKPHFSPRQIGTAVDHYFANGQSYIGTSRTLGYPNRMMLAKWVASSGKHTKQDCIKSSRVARFEQDVIETTIRVLKKAEDINLETLTNREKVDVIDVLRTDYRLNILLLHFKISKSSYFHAEAPNTLWLTDVTEFPLPVGKVYLSSVVDCFDGMAVSWAIGCSPTAELANTMLEQVIDQLSVGAQPIIHSDRGGHYRWPKWVEIVDNAKLTRSMSRKGCSPDNAACEGFFGRIKNEIFYGRSWLGVSVDAFIAELDNYLHWYNEDRIKLSLGAMSPRDYRQNFKCTAGTFIIHQIVGNPTIFKLLSM